MKQILPVIAAGLLLAGCGGGSTVTPPKAPPATAGAGTSTPVVTGPIPVTLGTPFTVADATGVKQGDVTFTAVTVDVKCSTLYGTAKPPKGHYLAISSTISTSPNITFNGLGAPNGYDFSVITPDGFTQSANTDETVCLTNEETFSASTLQPNSKYKGTTLLDVPSTSGTLIFRPHFQTTLPGWSLKYPAGSGGASNGTAGASPTATASSVPQSATAAPTTGSAPAVWTREEAQQHYLALVAPENADLAAFKQRPQAQQQEVGVLDKVCGQLAADDHNVAIGLAAGQWPLELKDAVTALIAAVTQEQQGFEGCATAQTASEAQAGFNGIHGAKSQANAVRALLGLPTTP